MSLQLTRCPVEARRFWRMNRRMAVQGAEKEEGKGGGEEKGMLEGENRSRRCSSGEDVEKIK